MPKVNLLKSFENPVKPAKKTKRKKIKYSKLSFKLNEMQYRALLTYCRRYNTTPVRYLKTIVNNQVERYKQELPPTPIVSENQLKLF